MTKKIVKYHSLSWDSVNDKQCLLFLGYFLLNVKHLDHAPACLHYLDDLLASRCYELARLKDTYPDWNERDSAGSWRWLKWAERVYGSKNDEVP